MIMSIKVTSNLEKQIKQQLYYAVTSSFQETTSKEDPIEKVQAQVAWCFEALDRPLDEAEMAKEMDPKRVQKLTLAAQHRFIQKIAQEKRLNIFPYYEVQLKNLELIREMSRDNPEATSRISKGLARLENDFDALKRRVEILERFAEDPDSVLARF
jgi:hypothetical protein